jgi:hypothetical protein
MLKINIKTINQDARRLKRKNMREMIPRERGSITPKIIHHFILLCLDLECVLFCHL